MSSASAIESQCMKMSSISSETALAWPQSVALSLTKSIMLHGGGRKRVCYR